MEDFIKKEIKEEPKFDEEIVETEFNLKRSSIKAELVDHDEKPNFNPKMIKRNDPLDIKAEPNTDESEIISSFKDSKMDIWINDMSILEPLTSWMTSIPIKMFRDYKFQSFIYDKMLLCLPIENLEFMHLVKDLTIKNNHAIFAKFKTPISHKKIETQVFPGFGNDLKWTLNASETIPSNWTVILDIKLKYQRILANNHSSKGSVTDLCDKEIQSAKQTLFMQPEEEKNPTYEMCLCSELLVAEGKVPKQNLSRNNIFNSSFFQPPEEDKAFIGKLPPNVRIDQQIFSLKTVFQSKSLLWHLKQISSFLLDDGSRGIFVKVSDPLNILTIFNLPVTFDKKFKISWEEWDEELLEFPKLNKNSISNIQTHLRVFFKLFAENSLCIESKHWVGLFLKGLEKHVDDSYKGTSLESRSKISSYQIYFLDEHRSLIEIEFQRTNNVKKLNNLFFAIGALKWFPIGVLVMRKLRKMLKPWTRSN